MRRSGTSLDQGQVAGDQARITPTGTTLADTQRGRGGAGIGDRTGTVQAIDSVGAGSGGADIDSIEVKRRSLPDDQADARGAEQTSRGHLQRAFVDRHRAAISVGATYNERTCTALGQASGAHRHRRADGQRVRSFDADGKVVAGGG